MAGPLPRWASQLAAASVLGVALGGRLLERMQGCSTTAPGPWLRVQVEQGPGGPVRGRDSCAVGPPLYAGVQRGEDGLVPRRSPRGPGQQVPVKLASQVRARHGPAGGRARGGGREEGPLRVVLHERERPGEVTLEEAASVSCDGRPLEGAAPWTVRRAGARGIRVTSGGKEVRCGRVEAVSPGQPAPDGPCRGRAALSLRVGALQRCHEGMLALRAGGGGALRLVLALPLERYVASVLVSEAADAPGEALAAQAVVTRSWALAHRGRHGDADACDLTHCQLYRGEQAPHADAAAARTAGQVLREGGSPVPAFFHAACGGHTAGARAVFGERGPAPVPDLAPDGRPWCEGPPWTFDVERRALAAVLGLRPEGPVRVLGRTGDGRVRAVEAFGRVVPGPRFVAVVTRALGYGTLRSARFQVQEAGERLRFSGEGRGHGVGFCQAGAAARARAGQGYRALLRAYFPGAEVTAPTRGISPAP